MLSLVTLFCVASLAFSSSPEENPGLFEGDIELLPDQQYAIDHNLDPGSSVTFGAYKYRRWPDGVVFYTMHPSISSQDKAERAITNAMNEWSRKTCITFKERTNEDAYVEFFRGRGCSSNVGRTGRKQTINLASGCWYTGTVVHEIGHALGFWHEQSRPDRDNYVTIMWKNIRSDRRGNFRKYTSTHINSLGSRYDYGSIMHYGKKFFTSNGRDTIVPKQPRVTIGQRNKLSEADAQQMKRMYGCR